MTSRNLLTTHSYHFGPPAVLHSLTNVRRCIALIFTTTTLLLLSSTNLLGIKEFCELMTSCNLLTTHSYHFGPPAVLPVVDRNHYFESGRNRNSDGRIRPEPEPEPDPNFKSGRNRNNKNPAGTGTGFFLWKSTSCNGQPQISLSLVDQEGFRRAARRYAASVCVYCMLLCTYQQFSDDLTWLWYVFYEKERA